MIEVTEEIIQDLIINGKDNHASIFYCYTPLCGTCNLARQMLEQWEQDTPNGTLYSVNLNLNRNIPLKWKIKSVPFVAVFVNGVKVHEFYAFHSVENVKRQLTPFIKKK